MPIQNGGFVWLQTDSDNNLVAVPYSQPSFTNQNKSYIGTDGSALASGKARQPSVGDVVSIAYDGSSLVAIKLEADTPGDFLYVSGATVDVESFSDADDEYIKYPIVAFDGAVAGADQFNSDKMWMWGRLDGSLEYYGWNDGSEQWDGTKYEPNDPVDSWRMLVTWDGRYNEEKAWISEYWQPPGFPGSEDGSWEYSPNTKNGLHYEYDKDLGTANGLGYMWVNIRTNKINEGGKYRYYQVCLQRQAKNTWIKKWQFDSSTWTEPSQTNYVQSFVDGAIWDGKPYTLYAVDAAGSAADVALYKLDGSLFDWDESDGSYPTMFLSTPKYLWMWGNHFNSNKIYRYNGDTVDDYDAPPRSTVDRRLTYDEETEEVFYLINDSTSLPWKSRLYKFQDDGTVDGTFKPHKFDMDYDYTWTGKNSRTNPSLWNPIPAASNSFPRFALNTLYTGDAQRSFIDSELGRSAIFFGAGFGSADRIKQLTFFSGGSTIINDENDIFFSGSWSQTQNWSLGTSCDSIGDVFLNVTQSGPTYTCSVYASEADRDGTQNRVCYFDYTATGDYPIVDDNYDIDGTVRIKTLATDNDIIVSIPFVGWQLYPRQNIAYSNKFNNGLLENPIQFVMSRTTHPRP